MEDRGDRPPIEDTDAFSATLLVAPLRAHTVDGDPVLILHFAETTAAFVTFGNGRIQRLDIGHLLSDFRYDETTGEWDDLNLMVARAAARAAGADDGQEP